MTDWWALGVATAALAVSAGTGVFNLRSAQSAERAEKIAKDAQEAAERVATVEAEREHRDQTPQVNGKWEFERRPNNPDIRVLAYRFTQERDYWIEAFAWCRKSMDGRTTATVSTPKTPGGEWTVWVEDWTNDRKNSAFTTLTLQFWPPRQVDGRAVPWRCLCGRDAGGSVPHSDMNVEVVPPGEPMIAWI